jgi:benzoyl-CoA reductase/2-hydroxyglutaryl-CoA dehydratase subunit BcrC/BadD/HgdB
VSALATLRAHYADPFAAARDAEGCAVGYVGTDVPRELVAAAGLLPIRLRAVGPASPLADDVLGLRVDAPVRRALGALLDGTLPVDFLVVSHESDSTVRLFTSLRALARDDPSRFPPFEFVDLLHLPTQTTADYNLGRVRELATVLETWTGRTIDGAAVRVAVAEADETRRLLRGVIALRRGGLLSGSDALAVVGATTAMPAAAVNPLLEALLEETDVPLPAPRRRVYLTGSAHESDAVYRAIEADGSLVVGEDHGFGEALADGAVGGADDGLAAYYGLRSALALRNDPDARAERIAREAAAAGADVVLAWIRTGDDALAWGLPALRRELAIPLAVLEHRGLEAPAADELEAALA